MNELIPTLFFHFTRPPPLPTLFPYPTLSRSPPCLLHPSPRPAAPPAVGAPQAMVRCAHCGLHLPASDAVRGTDGTPFCSAAHRQVAERA